MIITATVIFFDKSKGGRINPPMSGYKPQLRIENEYTSCIIKPKDFEGDSMAFGVEHVVYLELMFGNIYGNKIVKNMKIELYEGSKLVGTGIIKDVSGIH